MLNVEKESISQSSAWNDLKHKYKKRQHKIIFFSTTKSITSHKNIGNKIKIDEFYYVRRNF